MKKLSKASPTVSDPSNSIMVDRCPSIDEVQVHHLTDASHYVVVPDHCGVKESEDGRMVLELVIKEVGLNKDTESLLRDCLGMLNHLCACPECTKLCERLNEALGKDS